MAEVNKYEHKYFENGIWHECEGDELYQRLYQPENVRNLINKRTRFSQTNIVDIYYFRGLHYYHRLDGPAIQEYVGEKLIDQDWYIEGARIHAFEKYYCDTEALVDNLFKYVRNYPHFLNQIILLAEHNKWLTEEQILLLKSIQFFV